LLILDNSIFVWNNFPQFKRRCQELSLSPMKPEASVLLQAAIRLLQPLVALLVRSGITYGAFCAVLKPLFAKAAHAELQALEMPLTASAISLLSGVHRADLRKLDGDFEFVAPERPSIASQVVGAWMSDERFTDKRGKPLPLDWNGQAGQFNELASSVSGDARPKAVLEELLRLGMVRVQGNSIVLSSAGATPNRSLVSLAQLFSDNLHDHLAASCYNWSQAPIASGTGDSMLEQAVFVDELTAESAELLENYGKKLWQESRKQMMQKAQMQFDHDQEHAKPSDRQHRVRVGIYVYSNRRDQQV
jgi:Family of unknown function (DUF6502)